MARIYQTSTQNNSTSPVKKRCPILVDCQIFRGFTPCGEMGGRAAGAGGFSSLNGVWILALLNKSGMGYTPHMCSFRSGRGLWEWMSFKPQHELL